MFLCCAELRTPMSGMSAVCTLLAQSPLTSEQQSLVQIGTVCSQQLSLLIRDILDFSKMESRSSEIELLCESFCLSDRVYEALSLVEIEAHKAQIEISCDMHPDLASYMVGDPGRLMQVFIISYY